MDKDITLKLSAPEVRAILEIILLEAPEEKELITKIHKQLTEQGGSFAWTTGEGK